MPVNAIAPNYLYSEAYFPKAKFIDNPDGRAFIEEVVPAGRPRPNGRFKHRYPPGSAKSFAYLDTGIIFGVIAIDRPDPSSFKYFPEKENTMNRTVHPLIVVLVFAALSISGCSTVEVSQDYRPGSEFSRLKTFAWKSDTQEKSGDIRIDSTLTDERIRTAVEQALISKGFSKAHGNAPDFHISYTYQITKRIQSYPGNASIGFGSWFHHRHGMIGLRSGTEISDYDEGLLIIDFTEPGSDTLLWRGKSTRTVSEHPTPENAIKGITEAVEKTLAQFPPDI